jgi:hypothetical protein
MKTTPFILTATLLLTATLPGLAQEGEPPFTWIGKGTATTLGQEGLNEFEFDFTLSVDEMGLFQGQSRSDDGPAKFAHIFVSEKKEHGINGLFSRNLVIVQVFNEYGNNPMVSIVNARVLNDKFVYSEWFLTAYEAGSEKARTLGIGNPEVTLMDGDELPWNLKSALGDCIPIGVVTMKGDYK